MSIESLITFAKYFFIITMAVAVVLYSVKLFYVIIAFSKPMQFKETKNKHTFAVIIPARDESNVIADLLNSLKHQNYNKKFFSVYVIVENESDPSCEIVKQFGYNVFVRKHLERKGKGYAIDECIADIYNHEKKYDAYLIFDADNVPAINFLEESNKALDAGFLIGIGYRNTKNWNDGWVAACNGLTFTKVNTMQNKARAKLGKNCVFSGTGYYISNNILKEFKGWPFVSLTEDYEISMYATLHNIKTTYMENAEYLDEQPSDLKTSCIQKGRWIKGYFNVRKDYNKSIIKSIRKTRENRFSKIEQFFGVVPLIIGIAGIVINLILQLVIIVWSIILSNSLYLYAILNIVLTLIITYIVLMFDTVIMLCAEKKINLTNKNKIIVILLNPFYELLYIPVAIKALFTKNVEWKKIEYKTTIYKENNK